MLSEDIEVAESLQSWLEEARLALDSRFCELTQLIALPRWQAKPSGGFKYYPFSPVYRFSVLEDAIFGSSETWPKVEQLAEVHTKLNLHYSQFVRFSNGSGRQFSLKELCMTMLPPLSIIDENTIVADTEFLVSKKVGKFLDTINSDIDHHLTVWPIRGISTDNTIKLDKITEFRELTNDEKLHCLNFEIIRPTFADEIEESHSHWFGLCRSIYGKKTFGLQDPNFDNLTQRARELEQVLEDFLASVPLVNDRVAFHAGGFAAAPHFEEGQVLKFGTIGQAVGASNALSFAFLDDGGNLSPEDSNRLCEIWSFVRKNNPSKFSRRLGNAARRMFYAETRTKVDDALVDLIVAAESIYLSDNNELSYRTSLYASLWADGDSIEKRRIFDLFRIAYKLRSHIVHGSTAPADKVTEAVQQVRPVLREAIRKALVHLNSNDAPPDWDAMAFGEISPDMGSQG